MTKNKQIIFGGTNYTFVKPYYLMPEDSITLVKATVKGSTLIWNIQGKEISYNQIKKLIKK